MEEKNRKIWVKRGIYLPLAVFCLTFGITWKNQFCLGDVLLNAVGLPAWSQGTTGLHYPAIPAIAGTLLFFYLFASTTREPKKTMSNLLVGTVGLMWILSLLQRMI